MLLLFPHLSCYLSFQLIMLLILPNLSCYLSFPIYHATPISPFIMLLIPHNLSCYSSLPLYHATHPFHLIMLLIFPNLSCYLSFPIYHDTPISPFIMLLILPTYHAARSSPFINPPIPPTTWYKWCTAENALKRIKKQRFSQPTNHETHSRRHVSAQIKPPIARNKLSIRNRKVHDNELNISTPFLQHELNECMKSRTPAATFRGMDRTGW
jgi:hypothetical protein